ncbi:hypothetical protein [Shewanella psychrotolerans]|uniref:hypothetical protein n=1 Tax=Shewanella psychrotolerans TaxID=2864206 RepID=UPI001C65B3EF|nr:hypothetical protein [Shewanella psychrotolerans]QYK03138.1 hypothetical protein K0I62_09560 [Shewanella psychrotolerans]
MRSWSESELYEQAKIMLKFARQDRLAACPRSATFCLICAGEYRQRLAAMRLNKA